MNRWQSSTFSSEKIRRAVFQFELKRKKQLQNVLLQIPQFVSFIVQNDLLDRIKSELQKNMQILIWMKSSKSMGA